MTKLAFAFKFNVEYFSVLRRVKFPLYVHYAVFPRTVMKKVSHVWLVVGLRLNFSELAVASRERTRGKVAKKPARRA